MQSVARHWVGRPYQRPPAVRGLYLALRASQARGARGHGVSAGLSVYSDGLTGFIARSDVGAHNICYVNYTLTAYISTGKDGVPVPTSKGEQTDLPPAPPSVLYLALAAVTTAVATSANHATRLPDWLWSTRVSTTPGRTASAHPASAVSASCDLTLAGQALRRIGPGGAFSAASKER